MNEILLDRGQIERVIPHRDPFLLLDSVVSYAPGASLEATKLFTGAEPWARGHFPGLPIFPGVLLTEALAQSCAVFCGLQGLAWAPGRELANAGSDEIGVLGMTRVTFRRPTFPGALLRLQVEQVRRAENKVFFDVRAQCEGERRAEGSMVVAMITKRELVSSLGVAE
ncbi:MAG: 3-hydroxyacyl-ACP dehydratase FabZ family protein [Deltaproteobacteria bacterium]